MSLNELTDSLLDHLCCEALGWEMDRHGIYGPPGEAAIIKNPDGTTRGCVDLLYFCRDLNLIQQHLVAHLRTKGAKKIDAYTQALLAQMFPGETTPEAMPSIMFAVHAAPARTRVLAFLTALDAKTPDGSRQYLIKMEYPEGESRYVAGPRGATSYRRAAQVFLSQQDALSAAKNHKAIWDTEGTIEYTLEEVSSGS